MTIRVVLADDQLLLRATFGLLINSIADMEVVGEAGTGVEAVQVARARKPDVIVMDIRMPEMDGIEATRAIFAEPELAATKIIILTTFEVEEMIVDALRAGASGFLGKGVEPATLLEAIRLVAAGESLLSPAATAAVISHVVARPAAGSPPLVSTRLEELTAREREILTLVGLGLSNDEIAATAFISPATAKTHVNRTMTKLGARDRAQLVIIAYENGLVVPGQSSAPLT
ncbi:two component transcriptional regulator, LuxR family [Frankineae bacterium MT45]|nr:two component transcriptional regulator, LuxR family [Frankineae bacterium MT45]